MRPEDYDQAAGAPDPFDQPNVDGTFICTPSHDQRPRSFFTDLLHGCGPCRPEPRSIAGGRLNLLEAATTVTECDWMLSHAAPDPPFGAAGDRSAMIGLGEHMRWFWRIGPDIGESWGGR